MQVRCLREQPRRSGRVMTGHAPPEHATTSQVPPRALVLSLLALAVPIIGVLLFPTSVTEEVGVLLWLTVLVPPFLLTYYRGWQGASVGLAAGMAVLTFAHLLVEGAGVATPNWALLMVTVVLYAGVCVGAGVLGEVLRRERRRAEEQALTDSLTGLPNRRHAGIVLGAAFAAATRGRPLAAIFFDVDHFKAYNDTHGHAEGDRVLETLGQVFTRSTRQMDISARYGGEEFVSILSHCPLEGAIAFTERVRQELARTEWPLGPVTLSAGIALYDESMGSPEILIAAADQALYGAKEAGRDCVRVMGPDGTPVPPEELLKASGPSEPPTELDPEDRRGRDTHRVERAGPSLLFEDEVGPPAFLDEDEEGGEGEGGSGRTVADSGDRPPEGRRILVVDDDEAARRSVGRVLRRLGYDVLEAPGPLAGLRVFGEEGGAVDVVVTDIIMPEMTGLTMVGRMVATQPDLGVVYMSGYLPGEVAWKGAPGAVTAFVEKPMEVEELGWKVRDVMSATSG